MTSPRFTQSSPRLAYEVRGPEGATPVLFIMGFGMRRALWEPQVEELSRRYRTLTFDNRGVGESERGRERVFSMPMMAEDARRVLDCAVGSTKAHLVGVSMGGMIAQELALLHPERLRSLTLIATHPGRPRHALPPREGLRLFPKTFYGDAAARMATTRALLYPPEFVAEVGEAGLSARMHAMMGSPAPTSVRLAQLAAIARHHTTPRLHQITLPTLVIRGKKDALVRGLGSETLRASIPGARLLDFPEAGHGVIFQCAAEVNRALEAHFEATASTNDAR